MNRRTTGLDAEDPAVCPTHCPSQSVKGRQSVLERHRHAFQRNLPQGTPSVAEQSSRSCHEGNLPDPKRAPASVAHGRLRDMPRTDEVELPKTTFSQVMEAVAKLPGVRINRASYLRSALGRHCTEDEIERAVAESPAAAGIVLSVISKAANTSITYETSKATGLSMLAGIPGGIAMLGTIPGDMAQYVGHMLRIAQKLAYIYSWPSLFAADEDEMDEATESILTLFLGVMVGVQIAQTGVAKASTLIAAQVLKTLPRKALTKGTVYPIVKQVTKVLGVSMTKTIFAGGVAKAIPVAGAALSGGLTLGTFYPMSKRLKKHLASLEITKPGPRAETDFQET